jgi:signal transduction histidine kinase
MWHPSRHQLKIDAHTARAELVRLLLPTRPEERASVVRVAVAVTFGVTLASLCVGLISTRVHSANATLIYLFVVLWLATMYGRAAALLASVLAFFIADYFFLSPQHTIGIHDPAEWLSLATLLAVSLVTGRLTALLREREREARASQQGAEAARQAEERRRHEAERREQISGNLRNVLTILNSSRPLDDVLGFIVRDVEHLLGSAAAAIYGRDAGSWAPLSAPPAEALTLRATSGLALSDERQPDQPPYGHHRLSFAHAAVQSALESWWPVVVLDESVPPAEHTATTGQPSGTRSIPVQTGPLPAPYRALLVVPILSLQETYGALLLFYTTPRTFTSEDATLAMAYADQVALAIANARLQEHIKQVASETERNRLARELHDTVTQEIFSASLLAESIPRLWDDHRAQAAQALKDLHDLTHGALAALRVLLFELRPATLEQMPLGALLHQLSEAMTTRAAAPIAVRVAGDELPLPVDVKLAFYRAAQEALTNAAQHAGARAMLVQLRHWRNGRLLLEVEDDGRGFDPEAVSPDHLGVAMMRERLQAVGATLRVRSRPGEGTRIIAEWKRDSGGPALQGDETEPALAPAHESDP